jgi:hypothetical protein
MNDFLGVSVIVKQSTENHKGKSQISKYKKQISSKFKKQKIQIQKSKIRTKTDERASNGMEVISVFDYMA